MLYYTKVDSFVGEITLVSDETHLRGLWIQGQKGFDSTHCKQAVTPVLAKTKQWLERYFSKQNPDLRELPIHLDGTPFQLSVWNELCCIPYGEVTTYKKIADKVAKEFHKEKMSAQAVGGAVGKNPISIIIPCHRVIGSDKSLIGYQGGLEIKSMLLELEGIKIESSKIKI